MQHEITKPGPLTCALRVTALLAIALALGSPALGAQAPPGPIMKPIDSKAFDDGSAYRWGSSSGRFAMERSRDGGRTWSALDLSALSTDLGALSVSSNGTRTAVSVHFEDSRKGWLVWSTDDSLLHIANTDDGGSTWRTALSLGTDAVLELESYPGPGRACLVAEMAEGMMHSTMLILSTDDDGRSWSSSSLDHGDGVHALNFRSPTEGFVSVFYPSGVSILFYRTSDGGKTWQPVDIPLPPGLSSDDLGSSSPGAPVFSGPQGLIGDLRVSLYLSEGWTDFAYRSTDGGQTWVCVGELPKGEGKP